MNKLKAGERKNYFITPALQPLTRSKNANKKKVNFSGQTAGRSIFKLIYTQKSRAFLDVHIYYFGYSVYPDVR